MTNPLRSSFRLRVTLLALLASVPAMLAAHVGVSHVAAELLRDEARHALAACADTLSRNVRQWDDAMGRAVHVLAEQPEVAGMDAARQKPALERTARAYDFAFLVHTTDVRGLNVARSDGRPPIDYADREWFRRARDGQPLARSIHLSRTNGRPAVNFAAPVRDPGGAVVGVAAMVTYLDHLEEVVGSARVGKTGYAYVVDDHGQVLARPDRRPSATPERLAQHAPLGEMARNGVHGSTRFRDPAGDEWLAHRVALPNGWAVVSVQKESEVVARAADFLRAAQTAVGVALAAIVLLTWIVAGRLIRPVAELTAAATAVAAGRWDRPVSEARSDELGGLARSFNAMVAQLREGYQTIEDQVRQRTLRIREQNQALIDLTKHRAATPGPADLQDALRRLTEVASRTLRVARASVWVVDDGGGGTSGGTSGRARIWCVDLFDATAGRHSCGAELTRAAYPTYFEALEADDTIAAHDAHADPRTAEFSEPYLRPLGIGAMLDAPIRAAGRAVGVLCHEHVGPARQWTADEQHFADCLANLAATAFESSERQRAELALRESDERYRLVSQATNDVVWDWVLATDALYWNDALTRVFGYELSETNVSNGWWIAQIHPDDRARVVAGIYAVIDGDADHWAAEYRFRRKDGAYATVFDRGLVARDPAGRAVRMIGAMLDITQRKRAEALELERAALTKAVSSMEQVLGVVGHELRTPLAGLRAMCEFLLTEGSRELAEFDTFLNGIHDEVVRMSSTVHNLLEAARLNSGKARWNWSEFPLADVCRDAVESIRPVVDSARVDLTLAVTPPDLTMRGDPDAVRRLLLNLLSNAQKHTPRGTIAVTCRAVPPDGGGGGGDAAPSSRTVQLEVRDTGTGIPPAIRDRLGEAFALNSGVIGGTYVTGTGLGVAICKGIVTAHAGTIVIESELGRGTVVAATLRADLAGPVAKVDAV